jgi:hypothetical protein
MLCETFATALYQVCEIYIYVREVVVTSQFLTSSSV